MYISYDYTDVIKFMKMISNSNPRKSRNYRKLKDEK